MSKRKGKQNADDRTSLKRSRGVTKAFVVEYPSDAPRLSSTSTAFQSPRPRAFTSERERTIVSPKRRGKVTSVYEERPTRPLAGLEVVMTEYRKTGSRSGNRPRITSTSRVTALSPRNSATVPPHRLPQTECSDPFDHDAEDFGAAIEQELRNVDYLDIGKRKERVLRRPRRYENSVTISMQNQCSSTLLYVLGCSIEELDTASHGISLRTPSTFCPVLRPINLSMH
jgi:hypothetical protein